MIRLRFAFLLLLFWLSLSPIALAWPPTYGTEYNFSSKKVLKAWDDRGKKVNYEGEWQVPAEAEQNAAKEFSQAVKESCGEDCTVTPHRGKFGSTEFKVEFKDGYNFNISIDPACVEIQTSPETLAQIKDYEKRTQKFIFDVAEKLKMTEKMSDNAAHLNIGLASAFDDDAKSFLRFFTRYHNVPELATGGLGLDPGNAPPLSHLNDEQRKAFSKIVEDVNSGALTSAKKAAARIQFEVYTSTPVFETGGNHYQGISVKQINKGYGLSYESDKPFELRAPRQPQSAQERTLLIELFELQMARDRASAEPIAFLDVVERQKFTPSEIANRTRLYVLDAGGDWEKFKFLLPPKLREIPADAFLSGKINWASKKDRNILKSYAPYVASSEWARTQMRALLSTPEAKASGKVEEILSAIKTSAGQNANEAVKSLLAEFDPEKLPSAIAREPAKVQPAAKKESVFVSCARAFGSLFH